MKVLTTTSFSKSAKKLHPNEKKAIDDAVKELLQDPFLGEEKKGDLVGIFVYKYKVKNQLWLLAYSLELPDSITLRLIVPHENYYRTLKRNVGR